MKRRNFILLSAIGLAAIGASYSYLISSKEDKNNSLDYPEALSNILDTKTILEIGTDYRQQVSSEDSEELLTKLLSSKTSDDISTNEALRAAVRRDFETGKTIIMTNGWVLSVTEARQCALFSINQFN